MLTEKGVLPIGIVVDGVVHKEFEVRSATVQDNIDATETLINDGVSPTALSLSAVLMSLQLVKLGTLTKDQITHQLLRQMNTSDWNVLDKASTELEKKLLRDGPLGTTDGGASVAQP